MFGLIKWERKESEENLFRKVSHHPCRLKYKNKVVRERKNKIVIYNIITGYAGIVMAQVSTTAFVADDLSHCPSVVRVRRFWNLGQVSLPLYSFPLHQYNCEVCALPRSSNILFSFEVLWGTPLFLHSFLLDAIADSSSPGTVKIYSFCFLALFSFPLLCFSYLCVCVCFFLTTRKDGYLGFCWFV